MSLENCKMTYFLLARRWLAKEDRHWLFKKAFIYHFDLMRRFWMA